MVSVMRRIFIATAGVFLSSLFLLLIPATLIIGFLQNPCPIMTQPFPRSWERKR